MVFVVTHIAGSTGTTTWKGFRMKSEVTLSPQHFGRALLQVIGMRHGIIFLPYRIIRSSVFPPPKTTVWLSDRPLSKPLSMGRKQNRDNLSGVFTLTRSEVLQGLSYEICIYHLGTDYDGNRVKSLSIELPDEIRVELEYITRGSAASAGENIFRPLTE